MRPGFRIGGGRMGRNEDGKALIDLVKFTSPGLLPRARIIVNRNVSSLPLLRMWMLELKTQILPV